MSKRKAKSIKRYISKNWLWIVFGLIATKYAVQAAYLERGYVAFGGEWFMLPILIISAELSQGINDVIMDLREMEEEHEESRNLKNCKRVQKERMQNRR